MTSTPGNEAGNLLSVVIPVTDHGTGLSHRLDAVSAYLKRRPAAYEVLPVDDAGQDATAAVLQERARWNPAVRVLRQPGRLGRGAAVRRGVLEARGQSILVMDPEAPIAIDNVERMLAELETSDCEAVIGVRYYEEAVPVFQVAAGLVAQFLPNVLLYRTGVVDSLCALQLYRRSAARRIFAYCRLNRSTIEVESIYLMQKLGIPYRCLPVREQYAPRSLGRTVSKMCSVGAGIMGVLLNRTLDRYRRPLPEVRQPWHRETRRGKNHGRAAA